MGTLLEKATGPSRPRDTEEMEWEGGQESHEVEMEEEQQDVYPHDFGSMQEHTGQVHVERKVDIALFIKLTARPALAMVKDPQQDSARTTERVKILMELLHQETKGGTKYNHYMLDQLVYSLEGHVRVEFIKSQVIPLNRHLIIHLVVVLLVG